MKKYLIKGLLALVVGGFTASCADKDGEYVPMDQQKEAAYAEVFKELIGGEVAPNHDWGFKKTSLIDESSQTGANTRTADTNDNEWAAKGYNVPGEISQRERDVVMQWFRTHENPRSETVDIHNYFIQNVGYTDHTYPGEGVELKDNNGHDVTITNPGRNQMDYIFVGPGAQATAWNDPTPLPYTWNDGDDHVNNFNASSGEIQHIIYSGSEWFGFHDSYGDGYSTEGHGNNGKYCAKNRNFVIRFIEVDGVVGCYVGFNYESGKTSAGWHLEPDGFFDDRVIKLVAAEGEIVPPTPGGGSSTSSTTTRIDRIERSRLVAQGRVFCEDLGTDVVKMDLTDIDFNDAVFDAKIWRMGQYDITYINNTYNSESDYLENIYTNGIDIETTDGNAHVIENGKFKYVAEICILAAGGTIPLKIGGNNGFEIHEKFGVGHTTIVNTMGEPSGDKVNIMVTNVTRDAVTINVDITDLVKAAILKGNTNISLDIIPIEVLWKNGEYRGVSVLQAGSVGSEEDIRIAPQKLCVPIGTPWVYERIPITSAYRDFAPYAKSRTPLFWEGSTNRNPSLLYPSIEGEMVALEGETGNVNTNPYDDKIVIPGTTTTTTVTETVLWEGEITFANSSSGTNSEEFTLYSKDFAVGDKMRIYGEATGNDPWVSIHAVNGSWINYAGCAVTSPYSDIVVTQDMIDKITLTTALWGKFCKVTKITKVVTTTN